MGLNKQKGNMYGFVTHTWNLIKGVCPHNCSYCYMRKRWPHMSTPRLDEKEFKVNPGSGKFIFVGSSIDMFADLNSDFYVDHIPEEWIIKVLDYLKGFDNQYLCQSKNAERMLKFDYPENIILCTTIESNRYYKKIMGNSPEPLERCDSFRHNTSMYKRMITIEPVMDFDIEIMLKWMRGILPMQINIGADSGGNNLPEPSQQKLKRFIYVLRSDGFNLHLKDNLKRLLI